MRRKKLRRMLRQCIKRKRRNSQVNMLSRPERKAKGKRRNLCLLELKPKRIKKVISQLGTSLTRNSKISNSPSPHRNHFNSTSTIK